MVEVVKRGNMRRNTVTIGEKIFDSKSEALAFYKNILNSYDVGKALNEEDFKNVFDLVYMDFFADEIKAYEAEYNAECDGNKMSVSAIVQQTREIIKDYEWETGDYLNSVIVDYHPDFSSTKCFVLVGSKEKKQLFSYIIAINGILTDSKHFSRACRHLVSERLREFKKQQFKNRPVKCALTNQIVEWEECQIDHKAPLTFSVIVKSFIVAHKIDISSVEYVYENSKEQFADKDIADKFDAFHKEMAVLRILATKQNRKLSGGARIKPTKKDGILV